ncbi:MAG: DPP IV N-terminal domain-containing protein, partial [Prevotella sp.]|nr:DPP IV N-terminal domain-containing protein [Prevotella sp.]
GEHMRNSIWKALPVFIAAMLAAVLSGCSLPGSLLDGVPHAADDQIMLRIKLDLKEDIGLLVIGHEADGENGSGGISNADGSMICWIRFDESKVPEYQLQMFKGQFPSYQQYATYPGLYSYKYPKAGEQNSTVTVHSFDIQSRQTRLLQVPIDNDGYTPRIKTTEDPEKIIVYTMNRHQDVLNIYGVNPRSTIAQLLVKEQADKYISEDAVAGVAFTSKNIIVPSDRDGHMQLYLYSMTGTLQRKLTDISGEVTAFYGYDESSGNVYYQAAGKTPLEREIYVTSKNGKTQQLSTRTGWNDAIFSKNFKYFINTWSDCNTPYRVSLCNQQGKEVKTLVDNAGLRANLSNMSLPKKEMFQFTTSEGVSLNGVMLKPVNFNPSKKYPVVMWQYGGPGSQQVKNAWSMGSMGAGCMYDAYLCQEGFIVVCVDGRGTGARGAEFEKCIYKQLGELEARDQVETAIYLGSLPYVDKDNIGIWGWSFGGFNTLMSMSEGRPVFKAGVAVAPPTDWRFYDSIYTERFMRTPQENPSGYDTNPTVHVAKMHGALLLCHGLADDNVHPQNTLEYTEALVQADKDFRMNIYTNRNHSIYGNNTRNHLLRQIANHFIDNLK